MKLHRGLVSGLMLGLALFPLHAETFRIATYNLENYLTEPTESRPEVKSAEAKAKVRESILAMRPDVIALQEIGRPGALLELRDALKRDGLDYPHWEHVGGFDTNIFVAVLSRFPITARRAHTNLTFLLSGRRYRVSRGFAEVDIRVRSNYTFTLMTAHLKSRRPSASVDESEQRLEEAKQLRKILDARLAANPGANIVVLGDMNDTHNTPPVKTILGRGRTRLVDARPAERGGTGAPSELERTRQVTWTHHYAVEDTFSRIDYILLSPGMAREWIRNETFIPVMSGWGIASDHRPLVAAFEDSEQ